MFLQQRHVISLADSGVLSRRARFLFWLCHNKWLIDVYKRQEQGLSKQLMDIIDRTAKETGGTKAGTLVQLAGVKGTSSEKSNSLYDELQDIEDRIKDLQRKYELERTRYWNQFNSMESILSNYNSQSMWLSQQFG